MISLVELSMNECQLDGYPPPFFPLSPSLSGGAGLDYELVSTPARRTNDSKYDI